MNVFQLICNLPIKLLPCRLNLFVSTFKDFDVSQTFFPVHNTGLYTFCCPFYGVYFSVPQTFQRFPNLLTIPNSPRKGCASFNERVPKTKKHRLQTVLYLNAKLTQTSIILGFYIVSIFAYLFGGGGGSRTPVRKNDQPGVSERSSCFGFRSAGAHEQAPWSYSR